MSVLPKEIPITHVFEDHVDGPGGAIGTNVQVVPSASLSSFDDTTWTKSEPPYVTVRSGMVRTVRLRKEVAQITSNDPRVATATLIRTVDGRPAAQITGHR